MTLQETRTALAKAYTAGDEAMIAKLEIELVQVKHLEKIAEVTKAKAEFEKNAKARQELAIAIHKAVKRIVVDKAPLDEKLTGLKIMGFTYKPDGQLDTAGQPIRFESVALLMAGIPKVAGSKGGNRGKSKDEFGISLDAIYQKFATEEDKARYAKASSNSSQWQVKVAVKKRAIADGLLIPVK